MKRCPFHPVFALCAAMLLPIAGSAQATQSNTTSDPDPRAWLTKVRIAAYSLGPDNAESIVEQATASGVYGIEVDNDVTGRYESLLHPEAKLDAIRKVTLAAHRRNNKTFVYIAGLECISADETSPHTVAKEHPDWLQRKRTGEPAIFGNKAAFWISKGEEDTWVSPYAADWRKLYMKRVAQIAQTGVDGIYVDIPYWMTHFTGWEDTWASFDDATVAAFRQQTGLDARKDMQLGNFDDPAFRKWVDFRIRTLTDFLAEIRRVAIAANPKISLIPEIYPGVESEATRVGADVYQMYTVSDAIAHEYEFGGGDDHTAASRPVFDWLMYQIGIRSFRAFAGEKPTWILNYSWDGATGVPAAEAMDTLAMSELMAGANFWDASGHVMSGSNDMAERRRIFHWIAAHEDALDVRRQPLGSVGVYFSDVTRNEHPDEFIASYRGALLLLLQTHRQFQIVTPRTLQAFRGSTLVLPSVHSLDEAERDSLNRFAAAGGRIVVTGFADPKTVALPNSKVLRGDPARDYFLASQKSMTSPDTPAQLQFAEALVPPSDDEVEVSGAPTVVAHAVLVHGQTRLYVANFTGIIAGRQLTPITQTDVRVSGSSALGTTMHVLPFLGTESVVQGQVKDGRVSFAVPKLERGAVLWFK